MLSLPFSSSCQSHRQTGTGRSQIEWICSRTAENVNMLFWKNEPAFTLHLKCDCEDKYGKIKEKSQKKRNLLTHQCFTHESRSWAFSETHQWGAWMQGHLLVFCICSVFSKNWYKAIKEKHCRRLLGTSLMHFWSSLLTSVGDGQAVGPLPGTFHACNTVWVLSQCWMVTRSEIDSGFHSYHASLWHQRLL